MSEIPQCCDQDMLVCANGVFECAICEERVTQSELDNRAEAAWCRQMEKDLADPPESVRELHAKAWDEKRGLR